MRIGVVSDGRSATPSHCGHRSLGRRMVLAGKGDGELRFCFALKLSLCKVQFLLELLSILLVAL